MSDGLYQLTVGGESWRLKLAGLGAIGGALRRLRAIGDRRDWPSVTERLDALLDAVEVQSGPTGLPDLRTRLASHSVLVQAEVLLGVMRFLVSSLLEFRREIDQGAIEDVN